VGHFSQPFAATHRHIAIKPCSASSAPILGDARAAAATSVSTSSPVRVWSRPSRFCARPRCHDYGAVRVVGTRRFVLLAESNGAIGTSRLARCLILLIGGGGRSWPRDSSGRRRADSACPSGRRGAERERQFCVARLRSSPADPAIRRYSAFCGMPGVTLPSRLSTAERLVSSSSSSQANIGGPAGSPRSRAMHFSCTAPHCPHIHRGASGRPRLRNRLPRTDETLRTFYRVRARGVTDLADSVLRAQRAARFPALGSVFAPGWRRPPRCASPTHRLRRQLKQIIDASPADVAARETTPADDGVLSHVSRHAFRFRARGPRRPEPATCE